MLKRHNKNSNSLREKSYSLLKQSCFPLRKVYSALRKACSRKISCFSIAEACCKVSGVCLLFLAFLLINPTTTSASALEGEEDANYDDQISAQSTTPSTVNISFSPTSGSASLTPTSASGASALISVKATVGVENSGGYTVYLGSTSSALTGKTTSQTIPSLSSSAAYSNLPVNTWGYNATETTTAPANPTLSAMPANTRGVTIGSNSSTNIKSDSKTFQLSFAANIGPDKPADTYENQVTLSVISSPLEITGLSSISDMQEMTTAICSASEVGETKQLRDVRDGKYYWVTKLKDNNCWMTQNLDLNLTTAGLTAATSDISSAWNSSSTYPPVRYETSISTSTVSSSITGTRSWDQGMYVIISPTGYSGCGNNKANVASCPSQFVAVGSRQASSDPDFYTKNGNKTYTDTEYDAHYLIGDQYQWNAATAGTGGTLASGNTSSSICPKGWKLPTNNNSNSGSFSYLLSAGSIGTSATILTSPPYFFVRGGGVDQSTSNGLFKDAGNYGRYWSSTVSSDSKAYRFVVSGTFITVSDASSKYNGYSVRCIAR